MNHHPTGYQFAERRALIAYEDRIADGLVKSRAAVAVASNAIRDAVMKAIPRADLLVNEAVCEVSGTQDRMKAILFDEDRETLLKSIMQAIDDHYHLPLSLLSREANEQ